MRYESRGREGIGEGGGVMGKTEASTFLPALAPLLDITQQGDCQAGHGSHCHKSHRTLEVLCLETGR